MQFIFHELSFKLVKQIVILRYGDTPSGNTKIPHWAHNILLLNGLVQE